MAHHGRQVAVDQGFAADEEEVADLVTLADVDHVARFGPGHAAALARVKAVDRKPAELAAGVADIGDRELEVAGTAVVQDLANQSPARLSRNRDGWRGWRWAGDLGTRNIGGILAHDDDASA